MHARSSIAARLLVSAIVMLCAQGCAGRYHADSHTNEDGSVVMRTVANEIPVEGGVRYIGGSEFRSKVEKRCVLDAAKRTDSDGNVTYYLMLECSSPEGLDIRVGRSLELTIDRNRYVLNAEALARKERDSTGEFLTEALDYPVAADFLVEIADAQNVVVDVTGADGHMRGDFSVENFATFRRFVNENVRPDLQNTP